MGIPQVPGAGNMGGGLGAAGGAMGASPSTIVPPGGPIPAPSAGRAQKVCCGRFSATWPNDGLSAL